MKLLLINPNTTASMTRKMVDAASEVAAAQTEVVGATAQDGPESIEGFYDEVFAVPPTLALIAAHRDADAVIIGCFDDTGVDAARCATRAPVVGICQAAMQAACIVANRFSVITTLSRSVPALEALAHRYGMSRACARIRATDVPVLALEDPASGALDQMRETIARALDEDRAEAIVLGCAGMADLAHGLSEEFGVPVVEGVGAATKLTEGLVTLGLRTSTVGGYAAPLPKRYDGMFEPFTPR